MFSNRWDYWLRTIGTGEVLDELIPQIKWLSSPDKETMKNLDDCVKLCHNRLGWRTFNMFVEWLLFAFGDTAIEELPAGLEPRINADWYKTFNLGLFLQSPYDYFGHYAADFYGSGKSNRTAYFPTPRNICVMMAKMNMAMNKKGITASVCDPCVGSGRLLMAASNYSINLYGMDIDNNILNVCKLNMWMYIPWGVCRPKNIKGLDYVTDLMKKGDSLSINPIQKTTPEVQKELLKFIQPDSFCG